MKKIIYTFFALLIVMFVSQSCDSLPEELFEKDVYLVKNGWIDLELNITETGIIEIPIAVGVSGTSQNSKTVKVGLDIASDLLSNYNYDKYRAETDLYYTELPEEAFTLSREIVISAGEDIATTTLRIDMSKLSDKYADYVLPLTINSTSEYVLGEAVRCNVLYHIVFKNKFSGTYSGSLQGYKVRNNGNNDESDKVSIGKKTLYAISPDECFFYAGKYDRETKGRNNTIVTIRVNELDEVTLDSPNPDLDIRYYDNTDEPLSVSYTYDIDYADYRYINVKTQFELSYTFMDLILETPARYRLSGKMSRSESVLK